MLRYKEGIFYTQLMLSMLTILSIPLTSSTLGERESTDLLMTMCIVSKNLSIGDLSVYRKVYLTR